MSESILLSDEEDLIHIPIYYRVKKNKNQVRQFKVYNDEEGKKAVEDKEEGIKVLNTKWKPHAWKIDGFLQKSSTSYDQASGQNQFDYIKYRENVLSNCLIEWDMTDAKGQVIPVSQKALDYLPNVIALALFLRYESSNVMDEEEVKKS